MPGNDNREEAGLARFVTMKKGGGGKVAINPDQVTFVRAAAGAFTDVFFNGQQVAVEGSFEEVVTLLSGPERRTPDASYPLASDDQRGMIFSRDHR